MNDILDGVLSLAKPRAWVDELRARVAKAEERLAAKAYDDCEANERAALQDMDGGVVDGIATIHVHGVIEHAHPLISRWCGLVSPIRLRALLEAYAKREDVTAVWLDFNSPGGSVEGIHSLSDYIANYPKPVHAVVHGECASAAYWLACRCASIAATAESIVGSVGVYSVVVDNSEELSREGVKVDYITSGPLKAAGAWGMALTEEQRANIAGYVADLFSLFRASVEANRTVADEVWQGGIYSATRGLTIGLVDIII